MTRALQSKQKIASTFIQLLNQRKFSEVTVCLICQKANVSRKVFYKYFKDKYDLIYFIFESDFISAYNTEEFNFSTFYKNVIFYFFENRKLYKKLFALTEQNSFSETFHLLIQKGLTHDKRLLCFNNEEDRNFAVYFFADALTLSLRKWIIVDEPILPQVYIEQLANLFSPIVNGIVMR